MHLFSHWQWFWGPLLAVALGASCGKAQVSSPTPQPAGGGGGPAGGSGGPSGGAAPGTTGGGPGFVLPDAAAHAGSSPDASAPQTSCVNLQCQQRACPAGATTSVSGTAYAPNGTLPLYNVAVYVPNAPLDPLVQGSSCERCETLASGRPIASALSDHEGKFKVSNVPAGKDIPLVFQVGKWRRKVVIPEVLPCQDNTLGDPQVTRLPRNRSEGDLPRVAITQGSCDNLVCLLPKLGIDLAETGAAGQDRAFIYYSGGGSLAFPGITSELTLWRSFEELRKYDMVINSCRCTELEEEKGPAAFAAVTRYLDAGGRMFNTHFSYDFLKFSPDPLLAAAVVNGMASDSVGGPAVIDTSFPKGKALADWIKFLDPSVVFGQIPVVSIFGKLTGANSQIWARSSGQAPAFVTINTPVSASPDKQCGRVVDLDTHVTQVEMPTRQMPPLSGVSSLDRCGTTLSKAEHVLAFMLFDLAACIQEDTRPPAPPVID
jgi:hypothetical protein